MKHLNRPLSVAITLLLVSLSGFSMSLGQSTGTVIFGRPLDLTIQARLDGPLDESSNCFSADIFQGNTQFDANRVRVDVKAGANLLEALIRIRSTTTVTEPWAKVILRSTCGAKMSRQYDFLTDFVSDQPASLPTTRLPVVAATARDAQEPAAVLPAMGSAATATDKALTAKSATTRQKSAKAAPVKEVKEAKEAKSAASAVKASTDVVTTAASSTPAVRPNKLKSSSKLTAKKTTAVAEGKSRLKMETFDLADERQVMLKMSTALLAPAVSDTPANAQALAQATAVWRALNAKPEDVAADAQKLQATTAELQIVKNAALKEQANLQERLRMAEEKKFANPLVYGLLALLVLTLLGLAWMWSRARKSAQASYTWLGGTAVAAETQPQSNWDTAEPVFVNTIHTTPAQPGFKEEGRAPAFVAVEDAPAASMEEPAEVASAPEAELVSDMPSTGLSTPMVFTKPEPKVEEVHVDNNPLWPAEAASANLTEGAEPLVITPTEAFMLPITQAEPEPHTTTPFPLVEPEAPMDLELLPVKIIAPPETLNIDLDFSKISPPEAHPAASADNNHIEFYSDDDHAKAEQAHDSENKPKSLPPLPKSVQKPQKPTAPVPADHKSNLIDFESFATPPAPQRPSRFTG